MRAQRGKLSKTPDYFIQSLNRVDFLEAYRTLNPLGGSGTSDTVLGLLLLAFSTVPDDGLPLGNETTDLPDRSSRESPSGRIVALLVLPDDCENAVPLVINAAAKIDAKISNRLDFIMPPRKFITNLEGQPLCQARSFEPCTEKTVK